MNNNLIYVGLENRVLKGKSEDLKTFNPTTGELCQDINLNTLKGKFIPIYKKTPGWFGNLGNRYFGWWVGAFLSDGWLSANTVGYAKQEDVKMETFISISMGIAPYISKANVKKFNDEKGNKKLGNSKKVHINCSHFRNKVKKWGFYNKAKNKALKNERACLFKQIPLKFIKKGSAAFLWGIFSGLIDGDGSASINSFLKKPRYSFRFSTSSPYLRDSVCLLCNRLGIQFSITTTAPRNHSRAAYTICFSIIDIFNNLSEIRCCGKRESQILNSFASHSPCLPIRKIPITTSEFNVLKKMAYKHNRSVYAEIHKHKTYITECAWTKIKSFPIQISDLQDKIEKRINNIIWYTIKNILKKPNKDLPLYFLKHGIIASI